MSATLGRINTFRSDAGPRASSSLIDRPMLLRGKGSPCLGNKPSTNSHINRTSSLRSSQRGLMRKTPFQERGTRRMAANEREGSSCSGLLLAALPPGFEESYVGLAHQLADAASVVTRKYFRQGCADDRHTHAPHQPLLLKSLFSCCMATTIPVHK